MPAQKPPRENLLINLICSLVLPTLILTKFSGPNTLGPVWGLVVALAFPIGYGLWDFNKRRHANVITIIGFVSVMLSGGLGLFKADGFWFAVKDAGMPTIIGIAVLLSAGSDRPLVRTLLYNDQIFDTDRVDAALLERGNTGAFKALLRRLSFGLAFTFLISAVLNFFVARALLKSAPGTEAFNAELGKMHSWGTAITLVPAMAMMMVLWWRLMKGLETLSGLSQDDMVHDPKKK